MPMNWRHHRIGDLLPAAESGDSMRTSNTDYLASDPPGHTITASTVRDERVYTLWARKQHVATLRVPVDDDGARRAAVSELKRRAAEGDAPATSEGNA